MSKPTKFTENESTKESWNDSLFGDLFEDRAKLFDGKQYPSVAKGLAMPNGSIGFGKGGKYTFKTTDVADKVKFKDGKTEFQARYKKDSKKFDLKVKQGLCWFEGATGMIKYENRGNSSSPHYVVGLDYKGKCGLDANVKFNPFTGFLKASTMYDMNQYIPNAKVAADLKTAIAPSASPEFNLGAVYKSPAGFTGLAFNHNGEITVNHVVNVDKKLSAAIEAVQPTKGDKPSPSLALAMGYKVDADHELKARVNKKGELNVAVKKKFSPGFSVQAATVVDASKPDALLQPPAFGFKLSCDM